MTGPDATPGRPTPAQPNPSKTHTGIGHWVRIGVAIALGGVILAPIALSSQDLYAWAAAPRGLALPGQWPLLVPIALDLAAAACIGMTIVAVWRRDRPGIFGVLVWVFALTSAYAQYTHGLAERAAGRAQDAWWAMPAFAVLGPMLLEVTLHRLRKWLRQDADEILTGAAGFGVRWLVAPWSTLSAWAASRREGIASASVSLRVVAERRAVRRLSDVEAVHYAFGALGVDDAHRARVWLGARGRSVAQAALDGALRARTERAAEAPVVRAQVRTQRAPAAPHSAPVRAVDAVRARNQRAARGWWTRAREAFYALYAARLDADGTEMPADDEMHAALALTSGVRPRDARARLRARYAEEHVSGARTVRAGVVLPSAIQGLITAHGARDLTAELRVATAAQDTSVRAPRATDDAI